MQSLLIHAWAVYRANQEFYIPFTHLIYLQEIAKYFDEIGLLSPVRELKEAPQDMQPLSKVVGRARVIALPWYNSYASSMRHYADFLKAYEFAHLKYSYVYVRYPVPFGWLCRRYFAPEKRIIHFVGDPVDTILQNPGAGWFAKHIKTLVFQPEYRRYLHACRGANVFTNGIHLQRKLQEHAIPARALISSTLRDEDFYLGEEKSIDAKAPRLLYAGYLRKAKGLDTLMEAFALIKKEIPGAVLSIVGGGAQERRKNGKWRIENGVEMLGHVEDRVRLNQIFRSHDIMIFPSVSEGSPRVVLEAMANGLPVVSTPVGSLPQLFTDETELLFVSFNEPPEICRQVIRLINNPQLVNKIRNEAFVKAKQHTLKSFIHDIFGEI